MLSHFRIDVGQNLCRLLGMELLFEAAEGDADYIPVVKFGPATGRAQFQPEPMRAIDVFGPQSRWMRAEVEEEGLVRVGKNNLQG